MKLKELYTEREKKVKCLKIGNKLYSVFLCGILKVDNKNHIGFIDYVERNIYLKKDRYSKETLNHEIIHSILNEIYLKSKKNKRIIKKLRSNEFFIESLRQLIEQNFKFK